MSIALSRRKQGFESPREPPIVSKTWLIATLRRPTRVQYCPRAKRLRSNTGAGIVGYLFETAHNAIAPIWQPGPTYVISSRPRLRLPVTRCDGLQSRAAAGSAAGLVMLDYCRAISPLYRRARAYSASN